MKTAVRAVLILSTAILASVLGAGCGDDPVLLVSIEVTPATATIAVNTTQQFTATGTFSDSHTENLPSVSWSSSDPAVATISDGGLATGVSPSATPVTIRAALEATPGNTVTGTAMLTVVP